MEKAIVLKNIRRDIPAMKPLAAKVIQLQRQLIEAVQRYQELNSKPDRDEALLKELLDDIARINQSQREELALVREAENCYSSSSPQPEEVNGVVDDEASSSQPITDSEDSVLTPLIEEMEEEMPEEEPEESVMDWEDLTRENWSENDKLLQKIERLGSRVPQFDFMSSVELVHVSKYKEVEEAMAKRKLRMIDGKPVVTTGPWQMIDIPTKVSNRRCNYLTGLHVTVRPKDLNAIKKPLSSGPAIYEGGVGGIKTRNSNGDSRGSSRNSSRASSPVSSLTDHRLHRNGHQPSNIKLSRSIKTRASKLKRAAAPVSTNNYTKIVAPAPVKTSTPVSAVTAPKTPITTTAATTTTTPSTADVKPFVTYTVVDGIPHFRVIFPPKNSSSNGSVNQSKTATPTSIVESAVRSGSASSSSSTASSSSGRENGPQPSRTSVKPILKRPRLAQGLSPTKTATNGSSPSAPLETLAAPSSSSNNKEELGRCIEKCGSWMGAPHFKIYRTFPPVNGTGTAGPLSSPPAPKLSSPKTTLPACIKSSVMPPKLIMGGNNHHNNNTGNKYVSIAPKTTIIAPMNGVKPRPPASVLKTCPPLFGAKNLMKECQQNNLIKREPKTGQQQSMGASVGGEEDLKKKTTVTKVVKLLPSGNEQLQSGAEEASHFSPPPTVIVADMSV